MYFIFYHAPEKIYGIRFSPSPPPPFRRIDFYCPPPIPKTVQKRPFASYIYIEKGRPFGSFLRPFSVCGKTSAQSRRHFVESHKVPHSGSLCDLLILIPPLMLLLAFSVTRVA